MRLIIVKRSALWTYRCLEQSCKDIADLRVIWDRRRGQDRRSDPGTEPADRRVEDRRRPVPHSWTAAGHLLATSPEETRAAVPTPRSYEGKINA